MLVAEKREGIRAAVVDLDMIRQEKTKRKSNTEAIHAANNARKRQNELTALFKVVFKEIFDAEYQMTKARFITRRTNAGNKKVRIDSDAVRLWNAYKRVVAMYKVESFDEFKSYIAFALKLASNADYVDTPRRAFGFVTSEKVQDEYFFTRKKGRHSTNHRNTDVSKMEERHASLFKTDR